MARNAKTSLMGLVIYLIVIALGAFLIFNWASSQIDAVTDAIEEARGATSETTYSTSSTGGGVQYVSPNKPDWVQESREYSMQDNDPFDGKFWDPGNQDRICAKPTGITDYDCSN